MDFKTFSLRADTFAYNYVHKTYSLAIPKSFSTDIVTNTKLFLESDLTADIIFTLQASLAKNALLSTGVELAILKLQILRSCFDKYESEKKLISVLTQKECYVPPQPLVQGFEMSMSPGVVIDFSRVLKCFFQCSGILELASSFQKYCEQSNSLTHHFLQSKTWKAFKSLYQCDDENMLIPIFAYNDDFEAKNALASHKGVNKLCGTYFDVPSFPPIFQNQIGTLFMAAINYSAIRSTLTYDQLYSALVEVFSLLSINGIAVCVEGKNYNLKFQVCALIGDNLSLNSLSGLVESFVAKYFCRLCKIHKADAQIATTENASLLRDRSTHTKDLFVDIPSQTGLKFESFLNLIPNFHTTEHVVVDPMHDLFEGCCRYELNLVLKSFLKRGLITLTELNQRIKCFDFGANGNAPPALTSDMIFKSDTLILGAAEMYNLVSFFAMIVGDKIERGDLHWELFKLLKKIIEICMSHHIRESTPSQLAYLVDEHHRLYLELTKSVPTNKDPNTLTKEGTLKPKHHLLVHYSNVMQRYGPLRHLSSFRFEAFHKKLKLTSKCSSSTKNLPLTLGTKNQIDLALKFSKNSLFPNKFDGVPINSNVPQCCTGCAIEMTNLKSLLSSGFSAYKGVTFRCYKYHIKDVVVLDFCDPPNFAQIESIVSNGNYCYFMLRKLVVEHYDDHLLAYKVIDMNCFKLIDVDKLVATKTVPLRQSFNNELYVCPRQML
jgi:hypothetical protein